MSVPAASLSTRNIRLSAQRYLDQAWAQAHPIPVSWQNGEFDPDAIGSEGGTVEDLWAAATWVAGQAGAKGADLLQVDVITRREKDPLASDNLRAVDSLTEALRVRRIPLYDFSAVVASTDSEALISGNVLLVQSTDGHFGNRSAILGPVSERDYWRSTATFRLRLLTDLSRSDYY